MCLDSETGEVKALVGGAIMASASSTTRSPSASRVRRSSRSYTRRRSTPALIQPSGLVITPATVVDDEPTTFWFDDKPYEPADFKNEYFGELPAWYALAHSLNVPAVKFAEMVGYDKVAETARAVGLNVDIKPTPSIALGAYEVMPLEIAGRLHGFPQPRRAAEHQLYRQPSAISTGRSIYQCAAAAEAGDRSARGVSGGEHDGGSAAVGHGSGGARAADSRCRRRGKPARRATDGLRGSPPS